MILPRWSPGVLAGVVLAAVAVGRSGAQEMTLAPAPAFAPALESGEDTVLVETQTPESFQALQRPVSPMGAFWRSLLIPGWGQAKLNRKLTGALFIGFEGIALGMVAKSYHQLEYIRRTGNEAGIQAKEQEREDWLILLAFNHLLSGMEAFVSAHLWDFPDDLRLQPIPGEYGAQITVPVRLP